jgi:hypothetical protein
MGRAELASNTVEGRMLEVQKSSLDMAGQSRLEQIRARMAGEQLTGGQQAPAVGAGTAEPAGEAAPADAAGVSRLDEIRRNLAAKDKASGDSSAAG